MRKFKADPFSTNANIHPQAIRQRPCPLGYIQFVESSTAFHGARGQAPFSPGSNNQFLGGEATNLTSTRCRRTHSPTCTTQTIPEQQYTASQRSLQLLIESLIPCVVSHVSKEDNTRYQHTQKGNKYYAKKALML